MAVLALAAALLVIEIRLAQRLVRLGGGDRTRFPKCKVGSPAFAASTFMFACRGRWPR
jgi:hypothetical protein